jgi:hypothetical protein
VPFNMHQSLATNLASPRSRRDRGARRDAADRFMADDAAIAVATIDRHDHGII